MLGERIQRARQSAGMSMRDLAAKAGVSAMAISNYERDANTPSSSVLLALSKVLGVKIEYFFREQTVVLDDIKHRKIDNLPEKERRRVLTDITNQIELRIELSRVLPEAWETAFDRPRLPQRIGDEAELEGIAESVRKHWQLGTNPIPDLIDTFEEHGLKVFTTELALPNRLDGLSTETNGMPIVVVGNGDEWVGDRQRFTLAHELAHMLLNGRVPPDWDEKRVEKACHRVAGALLVPATEARRLLGHGRKHIEPRELYELKHEFGLSMLGWALRARDLGIITQTAMNELWTQFKDRGWNLREPDEQYPQETARRFKQLVYHALAEGLIGEAKAAELLRQSLYEFRHERELPANNEGRGERPTDAAD